MGDLSSRTALTVKQFEWLGEVLADAHTWTVAGDCTYGYKYVSEPKLGMKVIYSYLTQKYHIEVWHV